MEPSSGYLIVISGCRIAPPVAFPYPGKGHWMVQGGHTTNVRKENHKKITYGKLYTIRQNFSKLFFCCS